MAIVAATLTLGLGGARAETAAPAPRPSFVPSPRQDGTAMTPMRRMTHEERIGAALRAMERRKAAEAARRKAPDAAPEAKPSGGSALNGAAGALLRLAAAQVGTLDLYASPNYANSKLPVATCSNSATTCRKDADCPGYLPPFLIGPDLYPGGETCTGPVVSGGIRKFVDTLTPLCPLGTNNLGNCIPLATPDTTTFPGADYYEIGLRDYTARFHSDLPGGAKVRGYYQINAAPGSPESQNHYLGPVILATTGTPVRVKFVNALGTGAAGDLFVPVDTTLSGTGTGPDGTPYTQNRATLHLHGGNTPWISDGTQHQWTVPAGENTTHQKGVSAEYVPDMWFDAAGNLIPACAGQMSCATAGASTNPGGGALSFYWTNEQSGRLMFYHDHAYGITRLNVYAGEAAGYLLRNPPDEDALGAATVPGTLGTDPATWDLTHVIPLVIQDKSFVPPAAQLAEQDPTWDTQRWGGEDALWFPHVYTPNQWPDNPDLSGTNPVGRWDYGPWFWPPQNSLVSREGVQRPLTVPCQSAAAVTATNPNGDTSCPSTPLPSLVPESFFDTVVVNGTAYPTVTVDPAAYRFQVLNASQERNFNLSFFVADASGTEVPMVPATPHYLPGYPVQTTPPLCAPGAPRSAVTGLPNGPDLATSTCWPQEWPSDSRQGGVPDPAAVGPQWIQLGSEGGILPAPAFLPPMPQGYEYNRRNIVVLNIKNKGLFLAPAERADVVADFSAYAGRTLILYNDAPAPVPAADPRQDYFTGGPDFTSIGGAPTTLPGYGPNTRTIMQIQVRAAPQAPQPPLDVAAITTALNQRFAASQPPVIVPQAAYNPVYNPPTPFTDTYLGIQAQGLSFTAVGESQPRTLQFGWKALHELFDTDYGRMNSLLASEIPLTSWLNQTTIPFTNFDPTTEFITDNEPQIWKVTHNGVDTHVIHFHLLNAQILNRVGWDGEIRPPDANELGWKESVRMNPLEDIYVALRPVKQILPWPLKDMVRPLDVDRPLGTSSQFTGVDIYNQPINVTNQLVNFGWEYVWHCHLLGHEEGDMLRAEVFIVAPETPSQLTAAGSATGPNQIQVALAWQDNSLSALSFDVQRASDPAFTQDLATFSVPAPQTTYVDATAPASATRYYRVRASKTLTSPALPNQAFTSPSGWSGSATFVPAPVAAVSLAALAFPGQLITTTSAARTVTLSNTGTGALTYAYAVSGASAGDFAATDDCGGTVAPGAACAIQVTFTPAAGGASAASLDITHDGGPSPASVALSGTGLVRQLDVSPATLSFASPLLVRSAGQTVTVTNTGTSNVSLYSIAIGGPNAGQFARTHTCVATMVPGASCAISVTFRPTSLGAKAATLTISSNGLGSPQAVALVGSVLVPALSVAPAALDYGTTQPVGSTSAAQQVTVTNTGAASLSILGVTLAGANASQFVRANGCGATLAPGASCTVDVSFRPTTGGAKTASLAVSVAAPAASQSVALTGTAPAPAPVLSVTPAALDYPAQAVGTPSASQQVTVRNTGNANMALLGITFGGPNANQFTRTHDCVATMVPGASCTVNVTFRPTTAGAKAATLNVNAAAPAGTQPVALTGTGQ